MKDKNSLIAKYLLAINKYREQLLSISQRIVADAYFSKESFVTGAIYLGLNVISRFRDKEIRFISMSGKSPNMKLNNTIFKEIIMYGVKDAA